MEPLRQSGHGGPDPTLQEQPPSFPSSRGPREIPGLRDSHFEDLVLGLLQREEHGSSHPETPPYCEGRRAVL